jgi:hypothetical protein
MDALTDSLKAIEAETLKVVTQFKEICMHVDKIKTQIEQVCDANSQLMSRLDKQDE